MAYSSVIDMGGDVLRYLPVVLLAGCAATVAPIPLEGGKQGYMVACKGNAFSLCYTKAAEVCKGNYTIVDRISSNDEGMPVLRLVVSCPTAE